MAMNDQEFIERLRDLGQYIAVSRNETADRIEELV